MTIICHLLFLYSSWLCFMESFSAWRCHLNSVCICWNLDFKFGELSLQKGISLLKWRPLQVSRQFLCDICNPAQTEAEERLYCTTRRGSQLCCQRYPSALYFQLPARSARPPFGENMNHGNWLCCHNWNPSAQGLTAECVTAGRSSLLKGHAAGCPQEGPVSQAAPAGSCNMLP